MRALVVRIGDFSQGLSARMRKLDFEKEPETIWFARRELLFWAFFWVLVEVIILIVKGVTN